MAFSEISKIVAVQMFWWLAFSEILYFICVLIFSMLMYYSRNFTNQILSNIFFWHCSTKKFRISEWSQKYTHWLLFITDVNLYQHAYNRKMLQIKYLMLYINFSLFSHETNNIWWLGSLMITLIDKSHCLSVQNSELKVSKPWSKLLLWGTVLLYLYAHVHDYTYACTHLCWLNNFKKIGHIRFLLVLFFV